MPIYKMQCSFLADSALPRDNLVITPHFRDQGATSDPDGLCQDLAEALDAWCDGSPQIEVKAYDVQGTPPVYPAGRGIVNEGDMVLTGGPREVACCLSYYGTRNVPRQRGRLYVPWTLVQISGTLTSTRPNQTTRQRVMQLTNALTALGGVDVDWGVWSPTTNLFWPTTNVWVDDEWDTIRSRGMRATTRDTGNVAEA